MLHLPGWFWRADQSHHSIGQQAWPGGARALRRRHRGARQCFSGVEPDDAGRDEPAIVERLEKVLSQIIEHEENARQTLLEKKPKVVFNHIGRAYGILANAHSISSKETMNLLSLLRLGVDMGLFPGTERSLVDELFLVTQPAHLQKQLSRQLSAEERDFIRADMVRERLKNVSRPVEPADELKFGGEQPGTAQILFLCRRPFEIGQTVGIGQIARVVAS
jgi:hypothetical protein